ncbi:helix-turn-helix transcriptional regulator [Actinoplanes sp. NPDC049316]|uniref:helix-turn-helix domain-containing protein n=1 Tax=Actinoplanes sp. NPDC049316 TaxID=3154727 RepID=UPI00341760E4
MSDLGATLRQARQHAGLSLSGMAKRSGYSRSYLGNVETGVRAVTPDVIAQYESVLGEDLRRRQLLLGSVSILAATPAPDTAVSIAHDINAGRTAMLTGVQTTHATDTAVAALVSRTSPSIASLVKWSHRGKPLLKVNATGILAKVRSPSIDNEAITVLNTDGEVRELYLTAVLHRVLAISWDNASDLASSTQPLHEPAQLQHLAAELSNPADSGARYCSALMLARSHREPAATSALLAALRTEPSRENLRIIGAALAGVNPINL